MQALKINYYKGMIQLVHAYAIPIEQKAPKLSHFYTSIYLKVANTIIKAIGKSVGNGTQTNRQQTLNLTGFLLYLTIFGVP